MSEVWLHGEVSVRQVLEALNAQSKQRAYTTIMTIMGRLRDKSLLATRRVGKTDFYRPTLSREEYQRARAEAEVEALVSDYGELVLAHFARRLDSLDPERRRALRRLAGGR